MPAKVLCPQCQQTITVSLQSLGGKIRCPLCSKNIEVPKAGIPEAAPAPTNRFKETDKFIDKHFRAMLILACGGIVGIGVLILVLGEHVYRKSEAADKQLLADYYRESNEQRGKRGAVIGVGVYCATCETELIRTASSKLPTGYCTNCNALYRVEK